MDNRADCSSAHSILEGVAGSGIDDRRRYNLETEKDYLYQVAIRDWVENSLGTEIMVPVYGPKNEYEYDIYIQSVLIPEEVVQSEMKNDTYNAGSLEPGITVYGSWENDEKLYQHWNNDKGLEPFVIKREFNDLAEDYIEIVEEFRLLFNLYYNSQKKEYIDLAGGNISVVKVAENGSVTVHKRYLKTYLALKEKVLVIHVDSRCVGISREEKIKEDCVSYHDGTATLYNLNMGQLHTFSQNLNYSILYAKKIIRGCDLRDCNVWPYNEEKSYVEFIIGVDDDGKEIRYTCNPKNLDNYFGANPSAPHYLTPVYFDAAVLGKYYSKPEIYKVEDGIIRCGTLWTLYIDNTRDGYVSAYLGDLGRNLPNEAEQYYWRGFNRAIEGHLSRTKIQRNFMSIASDSETSDFIFKRKYVDVNSKFTKKFGWPLFLPLTEYDLYNFEIIRIPINNSVAEMDMLVLSLVKVLIDSLNEKEIIKQLNGEYVKLVGSISKIEAWLNEKEIEGASKHIKYLRKLQELRSSGTGHRKGKGYQKISRALDIQKENYAETFTRLLESATSFLELIERNFDNLI